MRTCAVPETNGIEALEKVDLSQVRLDPIWSRALPASGARRFRAIGLCRVKDEVIVATSNPRLTMVQDFVASKLREPFRFVRADESALRRLLAQVYPQQVPAGRCDEEPATSETVDACDELVRAALLRGASDIHLLPGEKALQAKFRVDGTLEDYRRYPTSLQNSMVSRIKILAGMNIAEKREPQDGRFATKDISSRKPVDIRVATIPTRFGERVTLRLLTSMDATPSLADLGMAEREHELFGRAIRSSNGLVLLTGPTGCGKSTTLYTAITQVIRSRGGNVITVEDPIEYEIPGATQVEVDSTEKVSFSRALRSILRHDPDVIMLGEIRDAETAELAIKASLTGHLVFSTLHTNTAAGAVTRLIDMGVEPFLVAATLRLVVAQRLVRRLCPECRVRTRLDPADAASLGGPQISGDEASEPRGCVYCAGKGFVGRTALFEMLPGGNDVSDLISRGASERELLEHMQRSGHTLLMNDGINKIISGTTTAQQVLNAVAVW